VLTILKIYVRCIVSLVFLIKLGKIVIVKDEKLSMKLGSFLVTIGNFFIKKYLELNHLYFDNKIFC